MMSPARERIGGSGGVPSGVKAGSTASISCWGVERSSSISSVTNARIEKRVSDIDQQIHQQQRHCDKSDDTDNQWFISIQRGLNKIIPEPRERENTFDHNGAGQQKSEGRPGERNDRHDTAAQRMPNQHLPLAQTLGPSRANII